MVPRRSDVADEAFSRADESFTTRDTADDGVDEAGRARGDGEGDEDGGDGEAEECCRGEWDDWRCSIGAVPPETRRDEDAVGRAKDGTLETEPELGRGDTLPVVDEVAGFAFDEVVSDTRRNDEDCVCRKYV